VTWPRWGMMLGGVCWGRTMPELHTIENGCGWLPTPGRIDGDFCRMTVRTAQKRSGQPHVTTELIAVHGKRYPLPSFGEAMMGFPVG
jgi:hypothetical protein